MSPGPSFFVVAQNALSKSRTHGIATALGTALGVAIFAVLASFGVTTVLEQMPSAFIVLKLFGGAYLLYLAYRIFNGASQPLVVSAELSATDSGLFKPFITGLVTQVSNPKTALVIAGIFAAFVPSEPPEYTTLLVTLIAFVIDFSWYALVSLSLSVNKSRKIYQHAKAGFDRAAAVFLGAVGIKLLLSDVG